MFTWGDALWTVIGAVTVLAFGWLIPVRVLAREKTIIGVAFMAGAFVGIIGYTSREHRPRPECVDKAVQLGTTAGKLEEAQCSHREHVLQRGREDGSLWLCICDAKGSEARRKQ